MRRHRVGNIIYGILLTLYAIVLIAAAYYGLNMAWTYAEEYERSRPIPVMEKYIEDLGENFWGDSMQATIAGMKHDLQTDDECAAVVKELLKDGVYYSRSGGSEAAGVLNYNLMCDTGKIGEVTITADKSVESQFDMYPWYVSSESFDFNGLYTSAQATVPSSYSVQLNGITLGDEYIVDSGIHYDVLEEYYDEYGSLPTKCTYRVDDIIGILEPVILNEKGEVTTINEDMDDSQFITPCTEKELATLSEFAEAFCYDYFMYSSGVINVSVGYQNLQKYIIPGGDIDSRLLAAQDGLSWAHTNRLEIKSFKLTDAIKLDKDVYLCYTSSEVTAYSSDIQDYTNNLKLIIKGTNVDDMKVIALEYT